MKALQFHQKWYFQHSMKQANLLKSVERDAAEELRLLLQQVPALKLLKFQQETLRPDRGVDVIAHVEVFGSTYTLACEVKSTGQPRHVRTALLQLRNYVTLHEPAATPVLITPYLSPAAQAMCREQGVGFLDLQGNAWFSFGGVFIDRQVATRPVVERRELRSMFKPKSAQVLRVLLRDPTRAWRVAELAQASHVSLGHASNVRNGLLDREWGCVTAEGFLLSEPNLLLSEWRDSYEPPSHDRQAFYTTLHGAAFEDAVRYQLNARVDAGLAMFASFSAAQWIAPYARTGTQYFYADEEGLERLRGVLTLSRPSRGENVHVSVLRESGPFLDAMEPTPGIVCTSPVQTYLDLCRAGERGREAADHLRQERLQWPK